MFDWIKNISDKIKSLNVSVDSYKEETKNQALPTVAYINKAKKLIEESRFVEAKQVLNDALVITETDALVYKYYAICEERLGNFDNAISMFKKSAKLNPQDKNVWHKLGIAQINKKEYTNAEKSFEEANKASPMNTDVYTGWGMSLLKQKKYAEAHEKFTNALKINRYNFSAMLLDAIVEIRMGKYDDADKKLRFLISANPTEGCFYEYANLHFIREDYDTAINYAQKSLIQNPNMLPAYLLLGKAYSLKFDYAKTTEIFVLAEAQHLEGAILYTEWANSLVRLYCFNEAKDFYRKALEYDLNLREAQQGLAYCHAQIGEIDKAQELLSVLDNTDELYQTKGVLEYAYGRFEDSVLLLKQALQKEPTYYYTYLNLAKAYEKLENHNMVKDSYDKITKFNENYYVGYLEYAKYLISCGDYKDAQRKLRKANKLSENNQEILNLLFYASYTLVKDNISEYNVKEALAIADSITEFKYPEYRVELEEILQNIKQ